MLDWREHVRSMAEDRRRLALVVIGVLWGTLSMTVLLAFGEGFEAAIRKALNSSGKDLLRFYSGATTRAFDGLQPGRWIGILPEDAELIRAGVPGVRGVSIEYTGANYAMEREGRRLNARVHGVDAEYSGLRQVIPMAGGRFINEQDVRERRRVLFLGSRLKGRLFGDRAAVGRTVNLWGLPFTVIGVAERKTSLTNYEGYDDDRSWVPATTFRSLRNRRYLAYLLVALDRPEDEEQVRRDIYALMGRRHRFHPDDRAALNLFSHSYVKSQVDSVLAGTRTLTAIVGVLGMLVSIAGVANLMYVLVEERRREIGVQMALGARPGWIARGCLLEGLSITFLGGVLGVLGSAAVLWTYNTVPIDTEPRDYLGYTTFSVVTALVVTLGLATAGCLAGYYPARRASRIEPARVLREE